MPIPTIPPRLLLVDDDPEDRYLMQMAFTDIGWRASVLFFSSAEAFLHFMVTLPRDAFPQLLLFDYHMPGMNGGELLRLLKKSTEFAHLPIIIYSSQVTPAMEQALMADGATRCFSKAQNHREAMQLAENLRSLALAFFSA